MRTASSYLGGKRRRRFRALQRVIVPISADFDAAARSGSYAIVDGLVARQPPSAGRQLAVFLAAIDVLCTLRYGRAMHRTEPWRLVALLAWLSESRLALLRRGIDGVTTLAKASVYGQPVLHAELRYRLPEHVDG